LNEYKCINIELGIVSDKLLCIAEYCKLKRILLHLKFYQWWWPPYRVVGGWLVHSACRDRNDYQLPGSFYDSDAALFQLRMIEHILFGLSIHLYHFQVIECDVYIHM